VAPSPTRRTLLLTGGGVVLTGCAATHAGADAGGARPASGSPTSSAAPAGGATPLARLADVPVGGAVAAHGPDGTPVVVARPTAGTAVAFSAVCTHMGCTVAPVGARLQCPCHGSVYNALTGAVLHGPAPRPLPAVAVHVQDGAVLPGSA
jgi:cytochrome b6-f complex iron-sulfur subunit